MKSKQMTLFRVTVNHSEEDALEVSYVLVADNADDVLRAVLKSGAGNNFESLVIENEDTVTVLSPTVAK